MDIINKVWFEKTFSGYHEITQDPTYKHTYLGTINNLISEKSKVSQLNIKKLFKINVKYCSAVIVTDTRTIDVYLFTLNDKFYIIHAYQKFSTILKDLYPFSLNSLEEIQEHFYANIDSRNLLGSTIIEKVFPEPKSGYFTKKY